MAAWPSGKAWVCKTLIPRSDSGRRLFCFIATCVWVVVSLWSACVGLWLVCMKHGFDLVKTLRELTEARLNSAAEVALRLLRQYDPDAYIDNFGNVRGYVNSEAGGNGSKDGEPGNTLLLDAHIDEISLIVTYITDEGFLKASRAGGVDCRVLPARTVTVSSTLSATSNGGNHRGVICTLPPHAKPDTKKPLDEDKIYIDCGFPDKAYAEKYVSLGDMVSFDGGFTELPLGGNVSSPVLDDRAGVAAILLCLSLLRERRERGLSHRPVEVLFSNLEELGERGAKIAAYTSRAAETTDNNDSGDGEAISVDVSFADSPGIAAHECGKLGRGVMVGIAPTLDRGMFERLKTCAADSGIPYQVEVMSGKTGTNADVIAETRGGIKTGLLSIPERNMHTPVEVVCLDDIRGTAELLAAYASM